MYASTNTGTEKPITAKTMTTRSIHRPAFHAASTPIGIAAVIDTISVAMVSATVGSSRCWISLATGRLVKIELGADAKDVLDRRGVAGNDRRRVARAQIEQREDEDRDHRHHRDRRENAPDDIGEHRAQPVPKKINALT